MNQNLITEVEKFKTTLNEISVYNLDVYTAIELYYMLAKKTNEVIKELSRFEGVLSDEIIKQNEKLIYLLGEGLHIEVIKKIKEMIEDGTFDTIINQNIFNDLQNQINSKLSEVKVTPNNTTEEIQSILNSSGEGKSLKVIFTEGTYNLDTLRLKKNTHIVLDNAIINANSKHLFFNFEDEDVFSEYNGNGNIVIEGGTVNGHLISMIHANDVVIKNMTIKDTTNDHYFEICACSNVVIDNCNIEGVFVQNSNRNYVECVQLDTCDKTSFPWVTNDDMFDNTINKNITIKNCNFHNNGSSNEIYTAIGSHVIDLNAIHENITIENCIINGAINRAINVNGWKGVKINNCIIKNCGRGINVDAFGKNVEIKQNHFIDNNEPIVFPNGGGDSFNIESNIIENSKTNTIRIYDGINIKINNNYFKNNVGRLMIDKTSSVVVSQNDFVNPKLKGYNHIINVAGDRAFTFAITINNNYFGEFDESNSDTFAKYTCINTSSDYTTQVKQFSNNVEQCYDSVSSFNGNKSNLSGVNKFDIVTFNPTDTTVEENDSYIDDNRKIFLNLKLVLNKTIELNTWTKIGSISYPIEGEKVVMCSSSNFVNCVAILGHGAISIKCENPLEAGEQIRLLSNFSVV